MARWAPPAGAGRDGGDALLALARATADRASLRGSGRPSVPGESDLAGADQDGSDRCAEAGGTRAREALAGDLDSRSDDARVAAAAARPGLPRQAADRNAQPHSRVSDGGEPPLPGTGSV